MSRVGKKPITIPSGVTVTINDTGLEVKGPKGSLSTPVPKGVEIYAGRRNLDRRTLRRKLCRVSRLGESFANNAVVGVTEGFKQEMDLVGVGYKAEVQGNKIIFALGYSHPIEYPLPAWDRSKDGTCEHENVDHSISIDDHLNGIDKQLLGQVAAELHRLRKPDAYKGKGVRYADRITNSRPAKPVNKDR